MKLNESPSKKVNLELVKQNSMILESERIHTRSSKLKNLIKASQDSLGSASDDDMISDMHSPDGNQFKLENLNIKLMH